MGKTGEDFEGFFKKKGLNPKKVSRGIFKSAIIDFRDLLGFGQAK